jgi:hypothetical protein
MRTTLSLAALAAALATTPAHAAHVASGWYAWSRSYVLAIPNPMSSGGEAKAHIVNGELVPGGNGATNGSWSAGPVMPGATAVWTEAIASNAEGETGLARSEASLAHGTMRATSTVIDGGFPNVVTSSQSKLKETIWFTNSTGSWLSIGYAMQVDGFVSGFGGFGRAEIEFINRIFTPETSGCNAYSQCVSLTPDGSVLVQGDFKGIYWKGTGLFFQGNAPAYWTVTPNPGHDVSAGLFDFTMSTTLWVPPGETTIVLDPELYFSICGGQSGTCGFGNSGRVRLGATPEGLSWASQSGVFLSALNGGGGGGGVIPEPGAWAMLVLGFGLVGAAVRRRAGPAPA